MEHLVKRSLSEEIEKMTSDEKKVYNLTNKNNRAGIVKATGFSAGKVSKLWQDLEDKGLLKKDAKEYKRVI